MSFDVIIWGTVTPAVRILVPLFAVFFVFSCLHSFFNYSDL